MISRLNTKRKERTETGKTYGTIVRTKEGEVNIAQ